MWRPQVRRGDAVPSVVEGKAVTTEVIPEGCDIVVTGRRHQGEGAAVVGL